MKFLDDEGLKLLSQVLKNKVNKEDGKVLSTNDFSNEYKEKIDSLDTTSFDDLYNQLMNKLVKEFPDLLSKELIYEHTGTGYANYDETITVDKNFADYAYIEVYCKTDDGYGLCQKLEYPNNSTLTFAAGNVGYAEWFFMKCKTYKFSGNQITTEKYRNSTCAGTWYYQYDKTSGDRKAKVTNECIGISRIVGYRRKTS